MRTWLILMALALGACGDDGGSGSDSGDTDTTGARSSAGWMHGPQVLRSPATGAGFSNVTFW